MKCRRTLQHCGLLILLILLTVNINTNLTSLFQPSAESRNKVMLFFQPSPASDSDPASSSLRAPGALAPVTSPASGPDPRSVYTTRQARVEGVCQRWGLMEGNNSSVRNTYQSVQREQQDTLEKSLMSLPAHSLLYCWIHKVGPITYKLRNYTPNYTSQAASTSWNKIFYELAERTVAEANLHEAAQVFRPKLSEVSAEVIRSNAFQMW